MGNFGARIRKARGRKSRQDIAVAVGVSSSTLQRWEKDENEPNVSDLVKLAQALGVSIQWLATGQEQKEGPPPKRAAQLGEVVEDVEAARAAGERVIDTPARASVQPEKRPDDAPEAATFPFVIFDLEGEDFLELEVRAKGRADALRFTVGVRSGREGQEIKMRRPDKGRTDAEGEAARADGDTNGGAG